MNEYNVALTPQEEEAKRNALIAYVLLLCGFVTGISFIAGGIWALVSKDKAQTTRFADHYDNLISVFLWGLVGSIVGALLSLILVGFVLLFAVGLWILYRCIQGLIKLNANKPYHRAL